ncbi:type I secretion system permease/ATPase [Reyranella sp. CPCC 100927]|uniref:type I secretion system permease/ATPase n=1 Tax=Reyranella sp. CPCC 100927 TaxID=2599616 RepID=UPI0011B4D71F|nr:type I secretion system permease/ATPase [Reyranella sp. CPCC 100927]TWT12614.1 type I secretion system permease/ATPase [Reyranella sp. CPCC 100927]
MLDQKHNLLWLEVRPYHAAIVALTLFSFVISVSSLTPTLFMLQLYERVMHSRNEQTLLFLIIITLGMLALWTILEAVRLHVLRRMAVSLHNDVSKKVFEAINRRNDKFSSVVRNTMLQDINVVREFVAGNLLIQLLDLCFAPLFIVVAFLFHPLLGVALLVLVLIVIALTITHQWLVRDSVRAAQVSGAYATELGRSIIANSEPIRAMGMLPALASRWHEKQTEMLGWQSAGMSRAGLIGDALRFVRHVQGPAMMTVGVLLFLEQQAGGGIIFAASVLSSRAIAPVDGVLSGWRAFWTVRLSANRIDTVLQEATKHDDERFALPRPAGPLVVARATVLAPQRESAILNDISFTAERSRILGVVGPSGAGKSSLAKLLVGIWRPWRGAVSLDGHDMAHWDPDELGRYLGYVPQDVELLSGTVAENIGRFQDDNGLDHEAILEAVEVAGIQDIVRGLPDGLNTKLGPDGHVLSGGQRQRIALARAVYGNPCLLVLDEPNSNLDAVGEESLAKTMAQMRDRGAIVIIVTHRMNMINYCDDVLVMNAGAVHAYGGRDQIVARLANNRSSQKLAVVRSGAQ